MVGGHKKRKKPHLRIYQEQLFHEVVPYKIPRLCFGPIHRVRYGGDCDFEQLECDSSLLFVPDGARHFSCAKFYFQ